MTNTHAATATEYLEAVSTADDATEDRRLTMQAAQIEATLALANEQARVADAAETANLIAYLTATTDDRVAYPVPLEVRKSLQSQIDVRLGLA